MKVIFEDGSYIQATKSDGKIVFIIEAKDNNNERKKIANAVEMTIEEFNNLISDCR